jgi:hypothetical protein
MLQTSKLSQSGENSEEKKAIHHLAGFSHQGATERLYWGKHMTLERRIWRHLGLRVPMKRAFRP